jgi:DNA-binding MarR family transcriptional regulator/N-acetylglutamate synthase-like GNAT family acetyltransferase
MHGVEDQVAALRRFNRFYTQRIGVLREGWVSSPFSLAQARVLYEISQRDRPTATELAVELGLDPGYLSRILRDFEADGLIRRQTSETDGRRSHLSITERGRKRFAPIEAHSALEVRRLLDPLPPVVRSKLVDAAQTIERVLGADPQPKPTYSLRQPRPGDMGWIVRRHAELYAQEYGWGDPFEGLCAQIAADFVNNFDRQRERCWIAETGGENAGCVMLVKDTDEVARLRLLLVEPSARGPGIGGRLVDECVQFARAAGYRRITLWTHSILLHARHLYQQAGFQLTSSEPRRSWGQDVVSEIWDLNLA